MLFVIKLSGRQIIHNQEVVFQKFDKRLGHVVAPYAGMLGIELDVDKPVTRTILESKHANVLILGNFAQTQGSVQRTLSFLFLTLFFLLLLLTGSENLEKMMGHTHFTTKTRSVKTYIAIEQCVVNFWRSKHSLAC